MTGAFDPYEWFDPEVGRQGYELSAGDEFRQKFREAQQDRPAWLTELVEAFDAALSRGLTLHAASRLIRTHGMGPNLRSVRPDRRRSVCRAFNNWTPDV